MHGMKLPAYDRPPGFTSRGVELVMQSELASLHGGSGCCGCNATARWDLSRNCADPATIEVRNLVRDQGVGLCLTPCFLNGHRTRQTKQKIEAERRQIDMTESSELARVREIVEPIASDLDLDVYDIERRGVTVRVTLDTYAGSDGGITLDNLSLATRLISREIDHEDPISTRFTLEITSPGLERQLRTTAHFQREVGKDITVRFRDPNADPRRVDGQLISATDSRATLLLDDGTETTFDLDGVDKARTVFEWGPAPKPNAPRKSASKKSQQSKSPNAKQPAASKQASSNKADSTAPESHLPQSNKEKQSS